MTADDPIRDPRTADALLWVSYTCYGCNDGSCYATVAHDWCILGLPGKPKWEVEIE